MKTITRRDFLKGIAATAAGTAAFGMPQFSALADDALYIPGTYTATSTGMEKVSVTMTFDEKSITDVIVDVSNETPTVGAMIGDILQNQIISAQDAGIDGVATATVTSNAVKEAAAKCIAQAKGAAIAEKPAPVNEALASMLAESAVEDAAITSAEDGGEYDIIVIGAGTSGVPCAVKAYEDGAKVLVLQKEPFVVAQGNTCTGIDVTNSDPAAIMKFLVDTEINCQYRCDIEQVKSYVYNSGEAVAWYYDTAVNAGYPATNTPGADNYGEDIGVMNKFSVRSKGKPETTGHVMTAILKAYEDKIDVRYSTPAVQLIKDGNKVTGVYAKDAAGTYYKFTAKKGVVLATGDYQNNHAMIERYCPDVTNFGTKQFHKTGDGQLLGMLIGAKMEPIGHTKMLHDFDAGTMFNEPFLNVDMNGKRFANEDIDMSLLNNFLRNYPKGEAGVYCQIFDDEYEEKVSNWGSKPTPKDALAVYMPEEAVERKGVLPAFIATYKADTLEELAEKLGCDADGLKASVARYNEVCDLGYDADFGKASKYMTKIEKAPFWGIKRTVRISAICSGILITPDFEVKGENGAPIENLYAIGNCSGQFYGSPDYPLHLPGLSIGRCVTAGYVVGKTLAAK